MNNSAEIRDKTIWITGASSGIGRELVNKLACQKNFVIASARDSEKLGRLASDAPGKVVPVVYDVTDDDSDSVVSAALHEHTDHLDMVIMCAGTCEYDDGPAFNAAMYRRVMDTNFIGAVNTMRVALPFLRHAPSNATCKPQIVAVSSLASLAAFPRAEVYGASKAALDYLMQAVSVDLGVNDMRVSIVRPGFVDTPLTRKNDFEMPFIMDAEKAASVILKGVSKGRLFINFPGKMSIPLRIANMWPKLWLKWFAPQMKKKEAF